MIKSFIPVKISFIKYMKINASDSTTTFTGYVDKKVIKLVKNSTRLEMDRLFEEWNYLRHEPPSIQISSVEKKQLQVIELMNKLMENLHPKSVLTYNHSNNKNLASKSIEFYIRNPKLERYKYLIGEHINYGKYKNEEVIDLEQLTGIIAEFLIKNKTSDIDKSMFTNFYKQVSAVKNRMPLFQYIRTKYLSYKSKKLAKEFGE